MRSAATLHVLDGLGGAWRVLGYGARVVPGMVRDAAYDAIAAIRHRVFKAPPAACPILPRNLRERFPS